MGGWLLLFLYLHVSSRVSLSRLEETIGSTSFEAHAPYIKVLELLTANSPSPVAWHVPTWSA
jgi:hypothetical protein